MFSGIVGRIGTVERAAPSPGGLSLAIRAEFAPVPEEGRAWP